MIKVQKIYFKENEQNALDNLAIHYHILGKFIGFFCYKRMQTFYIVSFCVDYNAELVNL